MAGKLGSSPFSANAANGEVDRRRRDGGAAWLALIPLRQSPERLPPPHLAPQDGEDLPGQLPGLGFRQQIEAFDKTIAPIDQRCRRRAVCRRGRPDAVRPVRVQAPQLRIRPQIETGQHALPRRAARRGEGQGGGAGDDVSAVYPAGAGGSTAVRGLREVKSCKKYICHSESSWTFSARRCCDAVPLAVFDR